MSKRKNRKTSSPNLPDSVLERARQQLNEENGEAEEPKAAAKPAPVKAAPAKAEPSTKRASSSATPYPATANRRADRERDPLPSRASRSKVDTSDHDYIREKLAHPTRIVTEAELRHDYTYVVRDLRSMGLLAAGLLVALVVLAQLLPK
jgi:hypothetical protein